MITYISDTQHINRLIDTLCQAADGFKNDKSEKDRVIALKAAQDLVGALQKPRDAVIQLSYSVSAPGNSAWACAQWEQKLTNSSAAHSNPLCEDWY